MYSTDDNELAVYGTSGEEYYPAPVDGSRHPNVKDWFIGSGLRFHLDTSVPKLMVYLGGIRHPRERDQAFAIYQGTDTDEVVAECDRAVQQRLVEERNWSLIEASNPSDQKAIYDTTVANTSSSRAFRSRPLSDYTNFDSELIHRVLRTDNQGTTAQPLWVVADNYQVAADLVHTYRGISPIDIRIYNNQDVRPPKNSDLAIGVAPGPYEVNIPTETNQLLAKLDQQLNHHRARERSLQTQEAISKHAEHDDDRAVIIEAVQEGFDEHYSSLEVIESERRERLESEREQVRRELERTRSSLENTQNDLKTAERRVASLERKVTGARTAEKVGQTIVSLFDFASNLLPDRSSTRSPYSQSDELDDTKSAVRSEHDRTVGDGGDKRSRANTVPINAAYSRESNSPSNTSRPLLFIAFSLLIATLAGLALLGKLGLLPAPIPNIFETIRSALPKFDLGFSVGQQWAGLLLIAKPSLYRKSKTRNVRGDLTAKAKNTNSIRSEDFQRGAKQSRTSRQCTLLGTVVRWRQDSGNTLGGRLQNRTIRRSADTTCRIAVEKLDDVVSWWWRCR